MKSSLNAVPEWTEYRKKNGLDPLGMRQSSINLYQALLPGISNVTLRIRYYGLYVWLSDQYAKKEGSTDPEAWKRYVRRAEALYALTAVKAGGESGIAGSNWASRKLQEPNNVVSFADDAEPGSETYYLKQPWGAYGAAYGSQLLETGLFDESYHHTIPFPTKDLGNRLANSFEHTRPEITELFLDCANRGDVNLVELEQLAALTPSNIKLDSEERELYEELLFEFEGRDQTALGNRKRTLGLILEAADNLEKTPRESDIRWWLYEGELEQSALQVTDLESHRLRWWAYQSNELIHIAYEAIMKYCLDILEEVYCLSFDALITQLLVRVKAVAKPWPNHWQGLVSYASKRSESEQYLVNSIRRDTQNEGLTQPEAVWEALQLLALVYEKTANSSAIDQEFGHLNSLTSRSIHSELEFLSQHLEEDFDSSLRHLVRDRVIKRHLWVALKKLRYQGDYTYLLEADGELLRYRVKDGPVLTTPRINSAVTFLVDIGLIDDKGLTDRGRQRLNQL
jgi:hypothetical protein